MDLNNTDYLGSSDFLKAADITNAGGQMQFTIGEVGSKEFTEQDGNVKKKLTLQFAGQDKGIVLNITNTRALVAMFGTETNAWLNQTILATVRQTEMGPGIMVTPIKAQSPQPANPLHVDTGRTDVPFDDKIPY